MREHIHPAAADGYRTGADTYVRGRPDYPPQVADWLTGTLGLNADKTVIDLGAGTGKFTGRLVATGAQVIAVEPVPEMLEKLSAALPDVLAVSGTATDLPLPNASVDVVVCAQAFHWFASPEALSEIARVLKPGGKLAWCGTCAIPESVGCRSSMRSSMRWKVIPRVITPGPGAWPFRIRLSGRCRPSISGMGTRVRRKM